MAETVILSGAYAVLRLGELIIRLTEVPEENRVFFRSIVRVQEDLKESERLIKNERIQEYLSSKDTEKLEWINGVVASCKESLEHIGRYVARVQGLNDTGKSVSIGRRMKWVVNDHEKLDNRRAELAVCHASLQTVLTYLHGLPLHLDRTRASLCPIETYVTDTAQTSLEIAEEPRLPPPPDYGEVVNGDEIEFWTPHRRRRKTRDSSQLVDREIAPDAKEPAVIPQLLNGIQTSGQLRKLPLELVVGRGYAQTFDVTVNRAVADIAKHTSGGPSMLPNAKDLSISKELNLGILSQSDPGFEIFSIETPQTDAAKPTDRWELWLDVARSPDAATDNFKSMTDTVYGPTRMPARFIPYHFDSSSHLPELDGGQTYAGNVPNGSMSEPVELPATEVQDSLSRQALPGSLSFDKHTLLSPREVHGHDETRSVVALKTHRQGPVSLEETVQREITAGVTRRRRRRHAMDAALGIQ